MRDGCRQVIDGSAIVIVNALRPYNGRLTANLHSFWIEVSSVVARSVKCFKRSSTLTEQGFPLLRRIARNTTEQEIDHRVVFGFTYQTDPKLVGFLRKYKTELEAVTSVRYSGELGHPFHVADDDLVVLSLDQPFIPEGRFASLLVRERELTEKLADGFQSLWSRATKSPREIDFHPPVEAEKVRFGARRSHHQ